MSSVLEDLRADLKGSIICTFSNPKNERKDAQGKDALWRVEDKVHVTVNISNTSDIRFNNVRGTVRKGLSTKLIDMVGNEIKEVPFGPLTLNGGMTMVVIIDLRMQCEKDIGPIDICAIAQITNATADLSNFTFIDDVNTYFDNILTP